MKVLWFSNTPANADEYFNLELKGTGGWLKALDRELQNHCDLHIAFYHKVQLATFKYQKTTYHPIFVKETFIEKIRRKLGYQKVKDDDDLDIYQKIIAQVQPDIIHIHGTENPFGCIIERVNLPVVVSIQGNITVYHHKFFSGFEKKYLFINDRQLLKIKKFFFPDSYKKTYNSFGKMSKREIKNLLTTRYIIGRTDWDRRITRIFAPKSQYFHNDEILRESFYSNQWEMPEVNGSLIIHTTTGNNYYKGFETLCHTLGILNDHGLNCIWQVAGISEEDLILKITKKKLGKQFPVKGLRLLGNLDEECLVASMLKANLYVGVSHIENSPNSLCEAMILGMPCISTFVGGTGSLIRDKENGILVQSGDPWNLAGSIIELYKNYTFAIKYGTAAKITANLRHNPIRVINDQLLYYNDIIKHDLSK